MRWLVRIRLLKNNSFISPVLKYALKHILIFLYFKLKSVKINVITMQHNSTQKRQHRLFKSSKPKIRCVREEFLSITSCGSAANQHTVAQRSTFKVSLLQREAILAKISIISDYPKVTFLMDQWWDWGAQTIIIPFLRSITFYI